MMSTISVLDAKLGAVGFQRPRVLHLPDFASSTGPEAVELAAMAGIDLDEWQQFVLTGSLGELPDGRWAALEVGVEVPRQNGKGGILEARELAGLFLLDEWLLIHSAHEFATAEEALERMVSILDEAPLAYRSRIKKNGVKRSHGQEGIYLKDGKRLRYRTRTKGGGRGFSADLVVLDEAMHIPEAMHGALMPTLSARPNPQIWYTGSAVDQEVMENGLVFGRVRERALRGEDPRLAYFGWSPSFDHPNEVPEAAMSDPAVWALANPALGIRITPEYVEAEQRAMDARTFAVERLGVGDWPKLTGDGVVVSVKSWLDLVDATSEADDPVVFAFDVTPERSAGAIGVAGRRCDGLVHVEIVEHERGTGWIVDRLVALAERHDAEAVVDEKSPAASLVTQLKQAGVRVRTVSASEHARACGLFFDAVKDREVRHLGTSELTAAIKGAGRRPLVDSWAWSRKSSAVDISPLVTVTLALWRLAELGDGGDFVAAWSDEELAATATEMGF